MPLFETLSIFLVAILAWFWLDSLKAREAGIREAREACAADGLQLLDDTVAGRGVRMVRADDGRLRLQRTFSFEYSDTGDNRRQGSVTLLGHDVVLIRLRPRLTVIEGMATGDRDE